MNEKITKATPEEVAKQNKQTKEQKAKEDNEEELSAKNMQLKNDLVNLTGGLVQIGPERTYLPPLDERIRLTKREAEKIQIMREIYAPINPRYKFENDPRYKAIRREELGEEKADTDKKVNKMEALKKEITERIPVLQKRINALEKILGQKTTKFDNKVAPSYIG